MLMVSNLVSSTYCNFKNYQRQSSAVLTPLVSLYYNPVHQHEKVGFIHRLQVVEGIAKHLANFKMRG